MSDNQPREGGGKFGEKITEQDVLKTFDSADDPFLTTSEVADELPVGRDAVYRRLEAMHEKDLVGKKKTGSRAVGWWATVAPRPSEGTLRDIEATEGELERGETTSQEEMKRRLGMDG